MNNLFQENFDPLKFINDMLMEEEKEEDWENNFFMFHDSLALQATEKSFYDALNNNNLDDQNNSDDHLLLTNSVSKGVPGAAYNGQQLVSQMNPSWISGSHFDTLNLRYDQFSRHGSRRKNNKTGDHYVMKKRKAPGDIVDFKDDDQRRNKRRAIFQMEDIIDASLYN
ncbi:hypothetical protein CASFOL_002843 [Castilleja foliolosa]|uniref:Uncharacterized protein n=1 Tax=Castilleja foliolosa TaxID=1961234 RepID=A0ABD3EFK3_9LAMI